MTPGPLLDALRVAKFDVDSRYHTEALLESSFRSQLSELVEILLDFRIDVEELVRGGGGKAPHTQRLGNKIVSAGWEEHEFFLTKRVRLTKKAHVVLEKETKSETHKVDHVINLGLDTIALEIEWNNKDPFFNRDLETFSRLHADGALSAGIIITRGATMQSDLGSIIAKFARDNAVKSIGALRPYNYRPTDRQRRDIDSSITSGMDFEDAWARVFTRDKYGAATTHWAKLIARLEQGVGSPCPVLSIGLPSQIITT